MVKDMVRVLITAIFLSLTTTGFSQTVAYFFSPGIRIGFNPGNGATISAQVSLGFIAQNQSYSLVFGGKMPLFRSIGNAYEKHNFLEFQIARYEWRSNGFATAGMGILFYKRNQKSQIRPKISIGGGVLAFRSFYFPGAHLQTSLELAFLGEHDLMIDFGGKAAFPLLFIGLGY